VKEVIEGHIEEEVIEGHIEEEVITIIYLVVEVEAD